MRTVTINIIFVFTFILRANCSTRQDVKNLQTQLLQNYDNDIGPNYNQSKPIELSVLFNILYLQEFDDIGGKLVFVGVFHISWKDDRLIWDPLQHGNITRLKIPQLKVWVPLLILAKPYDTLIHVSQEYLSVRYLPDGTALWEVPGIFETSCTANVAYFPFDKQLCELYLLPWGSVGEAFEFYLPLDYMTKDEFIENGSWEVISTHLRATYRFLGNILIMVIKFQRRPLFSIINLYMPISLVSILNMFIFVLPPEPGERSAFGVTILLALAVFLSIISDKLPSSSEPHIAHLSISLLARLALSALAMIFAIFGQNLYNKEHEKPVPKWLKKFIVRCSKLKKQDRAERNMQCNKEKSAGDIGSLNVRQEEDNQDKSNNEFTVLRGAKEEEIQSKSDDDIKGLDVTQEQEKEEGPGNHNGQYGNRSKRSTPLKITDEWNHPHSTHRVRKTKINSVSPANPSEAKNNFNKCDTKQVVWTDVASFFDKICITLFTFINAIMFAAEVIDTAIYVNSDF